jgi:hypothetical protein
MTQTQVQERSEVETNAIIAEQNDRFRTTWGADFTVAGQIVFTRGVADLSPVSKAIIMQRVQTFSEFTEDNDPYRDHTFGAFDVDGEGGTEKLFWKIDLYDTEYIMGSNDVSVTRRVLTILLASEY